MQVHYKVAPGQSLKRPWLTLFFGDQPVVPIFALVDSGSDDTSFPLRLGVVLGFTYDADRAPMLGQAAGSTFEYWEGTNSLTVQTEVGWVTIRHPHLTRGGIDHPLLGRSDFFTSYTVKFDEMGLVMEIEPYERPRTN